MSGPVIGPETRVADLLSAYPEAEELLIEIAPQFKALKNPILRRTVAKVATLEQAARVAGLQPRELVMALRTQLGFGDGESGISEDVADAGEVWPTWASGDAVATIDGGALLDSGETPIAKAAVALADMDSAEVLVISAPFQPAPLIDSLRSKGHEVFAAEQDDSTWKIWIRKA